MILLNDVVHILVGPASAFFRQQFVLFKIADGADVGGILVDIDYPWGGDISFAQDFAEKRLAARVPRVWFRRKSSVWPVESTARYKYIHFPLTLTYVSSTRQE